MNATTASDDRLIELYCEGDEQAFEVLVHRYGAQLVGAIDGVVRDHHLALDIAQEVFVKLCRTLHRYRARGRFRALIFSMALNRARDALRQRRRSRLIFWDARRREGSAAPLPDPAGRSDARAAIEAALERVSEPFRTALYLREVAGLNYVEIAATLACSIGTAKSRVHRGRGEFRRAYLALVEDRCDPSRGGSHAS